MSSPAGAAAPPAQPRGMRGTWRSMVISMLVVVGAVAVWVAMVPRVSTTSTPVVNPGGIAREINKKQGWTVALAQGLGERWVPTNVRLIEIEGRPTTWHAGYQTPSRAYVSVEQTPNGTAAWIDRQVPRGKPERTVVLGGSRWTRYVGGASEQNAVVRQEPLGGLSTLVVGKADFAELEQLAAALRPTSSTTGLP